jgi:glycosyltransferase involved in cell wall biosynthesis
VKTAIIGPFFSSSGTTRHVRNLFRGLSEINPNNVVLITFREMNETLSIDTEIDNYFNVFDKVPSPENFAEFSDFIYDIVMQNEIAVLLPQIKPFILLCARFAKQKLRDNGKDVKIVGTWHSNFSWIIQAPYHLAMAHIGIQFCDGIIPVSDDVKDSITKYLDYPNSRISNIIPPGGIDFDLINEPRPELQKDLQEKFSIDKKYIIFLGRLLYNKGLDTLIQSFTSISDDYYLVIIGKGPFENELRKLIEELKIESRVIFTDYVSDDEVYALLQGAELYCLPSRWESFSISTLEAMAAGSPVICSNVGGLGVWASKAAVMVKPDDVDELTYQLRRVVTDDELLHTLSKKSKDLAKKYDYKGIAKKSQEVIETISGITKPPMGEASKPNLVFNQETGEIRYLDLNSKDKFPKMMRITTFALYFPSEGLENEEKAVKSSLKYYQQ